MWTECTFTPGKCTCKHKHIHKYYRCYRQVGKHKQCILVDSRVVCGAVLEEERFIIYIHIYSICTSTHFHTLSHQRSIQNTTGIALIPCSPCSINNCSVLVNLRKQAGAMKTETGCSKDSSCLTGVSAHFLHSLNVLYQWVCSHPHQYPSYAQGFGACM